MEKKMFYIIRPFIRSFYYMWHNIEKMYTILGSISDKQSDEVFINKWKGLRDTIKFYKIDIRNLKTLSIDDVELIQYAGVHIWRFYECTFGMLFNINRNIMHLIYAKLLNKQDLKIRKMKWLIS